MSIDWNEIMGIDWNEAPDWANWAAQDECGEWFWFENKPKAEDEGWDDSKTCDENKHEIMKCEAPCEDWRDTLTPRPTGVVDVTA